MILTFIEVLSRATLIRLCPELTIPFVFLEKIYLLMYVIDFGWKLWEREMHLVEEIEVPAMWL